MAPCAVFVEDDQWPCFVLLCLPAFSESPEGVTCNEWALGDNGLLIVSLLHVTVLDLLSKIVENQVKAQEWDK